MIATIEGLDYTGKSTLMKNLVPHFPDWYFIEYPDYSKESGKLIRGYYDGEIKLNVEFVDSLLESNRGETSDEVKGAPGAILGRSALSGVAYRLAAQYEGDTTLPEYKDYVKHELVTQLSRETRLHGTKHPEVVIYLDTTADEILTHMVDRRDRSVDLREGDGFQRRVELNFHHILSACPSIGIKVHMVKIFGVSKGNVVRIKPESLAREVARCIKS